MVTAFVAAGASTAGAEVGPLVQISGVSPFGALADCGDFPGIGEGTNFVNSEVEPWLEVNPTNPDNIVALWQQDRWSDGGARGNVAGVSKNGGVSWALVPIPGITDCTGGPWERASDPWVSFSPDGTLHQMSLVFDTDHVAGFGANAMVASKSEDGGLTWSDPITLIEDSMPRILNDKNSLTADPNDSKFVYAVWDRLQISGAETVFPENMIPGRGFALGVGLFFKGPIYFARSTDGGDTWEPARQIYQTGGLDQTIGNQIVVLPNELGGTVIDFFTELKNVENSDQEGPGFNFNLAFIRSNNKGRTWQPSGRASVVARILSSFGAVTPDDQVPVRDGSILFDVAVDPNSGALYAVWQDIRFNGIEQVAFSQSFDGGLTWSTPVKINQTPTEIALLRQQAFLPSVAVAGDGSLAVTYYDFRNDDDTGELADYWAIYCSSSCSSPMSWASEDRLTDVSFNYLDAPFARGLFLGDYEGLASDGVDFLPAFGIAGPVDPASMYFRPFFGP